MKNPSPEKIIKLFVSVCLMPIIHEKFDDIKIKMKIEEAVQEAMEIHDKIVFWDAQKFKESGH